MVEFGLKPSGVSAVLCSAAAIKHTTQRQESLYTKSNRVVRFV
jgi:hypothetical protein